MKRYDMIRIELRTAKEVRDDDDSACTCVRTGVHGRTEGRCSVRWSDVSTGTKGRI